MKAVLISIQPKWCAKIASGEKTIEVRKTRPNLQTPFKCYIYCTKGKDLLREVDNWHTGTKTHTTNYRIINLDYCTNKIANGKVVGEFVCDRIDRISKRGTNNNFGYCYLSLNEWGNDDIEIEITDIQKSCISKSELNAYGANSSCLYAWHISDLKIYDKPKELSEFYKECKDVKDFPNSCRRKSCDHYYEEWQNCYAECCFNGERPLERPPQSWCYCEKLKEQENG